jgi:2-haloacid dehalogenase/putative hydrolase of the HAD superfamily
MKPSFQVVTFDCYGTLIDWESGIESAFASALGPGGKIGRQELLSAYAECEAAVEAEPYRSYAEVLGETARRVGEKLGRPIPSSDDFLARSLPGWRPFPDTNPALERLASAGIRLGILSNTDDGLLAATRRHFTVPFDLIVTAQQVRSYKPGLAHFEEARRRFGGARWLHAAQSHFHDVVPARRLSISVAWINRKGEKPAGGILPYFEVPTLRELADRLLS